MKQKIVSHTLTPLDPKICFLEGATVTGSTLIFWEYICVCVSSRPVTCFFILKDILQLSF